MITLLGEVQKLVQEVNEQKCNGELTDRQVYVISQQICNLPWIYSKIGTPLKDVDGYAGEDYTVAGNSDWNKVKDPILINSWLSALLYNGVENRPVSIESSCLPHIVSYPGKMSLNEYLNENEITHFTLENLDHPKTIVNKWIKMINEGYKIDINLNEVNEVFDYVVFMGNQIGKPILHD